MKTSSLARIPFTAVCIMINLFVLQCSGFTLALQEQGALTGGIIGGGGPVIITPIATDHWQVTIQDPRIGNPAGPPFALAFIEPETVNNLTAYNNVQLLSLSPGQAVLDVLSDEFSPYANIVPNGATALVENTDVQPFSLQFTDFADSAPEPNCGMLFVAAGLVAWWKRGRRTLAAQARVS